MHDHLNEAEALERVLAGATTDACGECAQAVGDIAILAGVLQTTAQRVPLELEQRLRERLAAPPAAKSEPRSWFWGAAAAAMVGTAVTFAAIRAIPDDPIRAPLSSPLRAVPPEKKPDVPIVAIQPPAPPAPEPPAEIVKGPSPSVEPKPVALVNPPTPAKRDARDLTDDGIVDVADARKIMIRIIEGDPKWSVADVQAIVQERVSGRR